MCTDMSASENSWGGGESALGGRNTRARLQGLAAVVVVTLGALAIWSISSSVPNERADIASAFTVAVVRAGHDGSVELGSVALLDWDHVYLFHGYADDARISSKLGFSWGTKGDIRMLDESTVLVVFVTDRSVSGWMIMNGPNSAGPWLAFADTLFERPIARDQATFHISQTTLAERGAFRLR